MPEPWASRARFAATTGLRQGEQRALLWSQIDLEAGDIHVDKAIKHRAKAGDPKTINGFRKVPMTPDVKLSPDQEVFPSTKGNVLSDSRFLAAIHAGCDAAGVERIRWHDLRHYYASRILQAFDNDWWTVTNLMGHKDIKTTANTYGHWLETPEKDAEISAGIAAAF